jgi:hypothetical protein
MHDSPIQAKPFHKSSLKPIGSAVGFLACFFFLHSMLTAAGGRRALAGLGGADLAVVSGSQRRGYDNADSSEGEE